MKVTGSKKCTINSDVKQAATTNGLKSAIVPSRGNGKKEVFVQRSSVQRYAELPSLRYGATPTPTATQMLGSGPLRVSVSPKARRSTSFDGRLGGTGNYCGLRGNAHDFGDEAPPSVRRVHFADLPPKFNRGEAERAPEEEGSPGAEEGTENRMRNRAGIASSDGRSVSSNPRLGHLASSASFPVSTRSDAFRLGNNGVLEGGTVLANKHVSRGHDTARYRHGTLTQAAPATASPPSLTPLLKAARDGDEDDLLTVLREAAFFGIPPEDLNAADNSGRTTLSYVASNGGLKALEAISRLPGVDVNKPDNEGNTPLHFAAQAGQVDVISYMVSTCHGLDIDARNALGFTPLMKAALQGRTKCAKLLLCAGASPVMRDSGRGLRAEQWARFCGRTVCADVIEKFSRSKTIDRNGDYARWGSEPELAARLLGGKTPLAGSQNTGPTSLKSRIRRAFRSTSNPGHDPGRKAFSVVSQLTSAALCASSPVLPSNQSIPAAAKSASRPLSVPKVQVTLATCSYGEDTCGYPEPPVKDKIVTSRPVSRKKQ
ncbi:UNVERIFIED_CONTAM: hypothetical protein PYX00_001368 [Menopon gallinae]|uniref:Ankyrin repeat domain-containing protein 33B n=1 Tax=Menopon gallinae TaxID=328185 RepID=A0AAW2IDL1_9NEOP